MPHEFDNLPPAAEDKRMEARVGKLESDTVEMRERLARMEAQMATKEDLGRLEAALVKWMVGLLFGFTTSLIVVMSFVLNYAAPPQGRFARNEPSPAQPAPIIITIPPGALQWQPAPEGAQQRKP